MEILTNKETVNRLHCLAIEAKKTIQPERFWDEVIKVCNIALEASFHLSEILPEDRSGPMEFAASKFIERFNGKGIDQ